MTNVVADVDDSMLRRVWIELEYRIGAVRATRDLLLWAYIICPYWLHHKEAQKGDTWDATQSHKMEHIPPLVPLILPNGEGGSWGLRQPEASHRSGGSANNRVYAPNVEPLIGLQPLDQQICHQTSNVLAFTYHFDSPSARVSLGWGWRDTARPVLRVMPLSLSMERAGERFVTPSHKNWTQDRRICDSKSAEQDSGPLKFYPLPLIVEPKNPKIPRRGRFNGDATIGIPFEEAVSTAGTTPEEDDGTAVDTISFGVTEDIADAE
ncbi:hypothetical protein PR048_023687 [Dryococelus australis]|uniref:Uncharacterized protein n=1 Tax=Dryococelus australis TaxID=614101 RepID=A0ABQ9GUR3_9NEOP|nr:hypothetical protein PR048_023687 [Dryococelus australis]